MRPSLIAYSMLALVAAAPSVSACDGKAELEAIFTKQQKQPWRTETQSTSDTGLVQKQTIDYLPPDRVHRTVTAGEESIETIAVGNLTWSNEGSGWQEMKAAIGHLVVTQMKSAFEPPKITTEFNCLGTVSYDGKSYLGYQTTPEKVQDKELARTILVDPDTKLPALNLVAQPDLSAEPVAKEVFSYPSDIKIEKPL